MNFLFIFRKKRHDLPQCFAIDGRTEVTTVLRVFFFFASFPFSLSRNKEKEMKRKA